MSHLDGKYILYPRIGSWEYHEIKEGEVAISTCQSNLRTHLQAKDELSWLANLDHETPESVTGPCKSEVLDIIGYDPEDDIIVCKIVN